MKTYNLFLDDFRMPIDCKNYMNELRYETLEWVIVRTHEEFTDMLISKWKEGEFPELVSFDHDLTNEHYHPSMFNGVKEYECYYKGFSNPTGRRSAEFLVDFCSKNSIPLPEYLIHTMNPAGKERILNILCNKKSTHT